MWARQVHVLRVDLSQPLDRELLPEGLDAVVHLAQANVPFPDQANELFAVNTGATQQLLDHACRTRVRQFILASTGDVYGWRRGPCRETDALLPTNFYPCTKHAAELLVNAYSGFLRSCVLRLFQPYGPGQTKRLIPRLAESIRLGTPVRLNKGGRPLVTPFYIDDVVRAFERCLETQYAGVLNIAGDTVVSIRNLADRLGQVLQLRPVYEDTGEEASDAIGDNARMKQDLGTWPYTPLDEGLLRTFANE
jgi:nucleoside-diphosphate-sugar epimerase